MKLSKTLLTVATVVAVAMMGTATALACTNLLVGKNASTDGWSNAESGGMGLG